MPGLDIFDISGLEIFSSSYDGATLDNAVAKGTWTASGTWTIPAVTLGGAITGASQNMTGIGTIAATSLATTAATPLLLTNGQLVNVALTSQTVGATTLTIPDFASVVDEFTFKTKAQTMANKTLTSPTINGTIATTGLTLPAVTLGGAVDGSNQNITNLNTITLNNAQLVQWENAAAAAKEILRLHSDDNFYLSNDAGGSLILRTHQASAALTQRLTITGGVTNAVATWADITHTGLKITSAGNIDCAGTGANGWVIKNPKNAAASALSGTQLDVEIDIGGTPYHFTVYPTKA